MLCRLEVLATRMTAELVVSLIIIGDIAEIEFVPFALEHHDEAEIVQALQQRGVLDGHFVQGRVWMRPISRLALLLHQILQLNVNPLCLLRGFRALSDVLRIA